ncbi:MAG: sigma-70 family RNA polymerase sigma factor [Victivallales bacterium]
MKSFKEKDFLDKLIEKSRGSGDLRALGMVYEYYYPRILKYMYYRSNRTIYEDLTAEVFQKVVKNIGSQEGNFEAWLYKIAENTAKDFYRSKESRMRLEENVLQSDKYLDGGNGASTKTELKMDIRSALERLDDEKRRIIALRFIQGLSSEEVAEITGKTPEAVRVMQFRSLVELREMMSEVNIH